MARIVTVVFNSVIRDIRVLKQAESLKAAGHEVTIIGLRDKNVTAAHQVLENGVEIYRPGWRSEAQRRIAGLFVPFALLLVLLAVAVASGLFGLLSGLALPAWASVCTAVAPLFSRHGLYILLTLVLLGAVGIVLVLKYIRLRRSQKNLLTNELYEELKAVAAPGMIGFEALTPAQTSRLAFSLKSCFWDVPEHVRILRHIFREQALARFIQELKPEILHCHDLATLPIGCTVKAALGCTLVFDAHEMYDQLAQTSSKESKYNRHCLRLFGPHADRFITVNESIAAYYARIMPFLPPAVVVKNATRVFEPVAYDGRLHKAAGVPLDRKILLYQGGFSKRRGLDALVAAAQLLESDWVIVMMGWGNHELALRKLAYGGTTSPFDTRFESQIRFIPPAPQEELVFWTAGATVGIIPYEDAGLNHWFCSPNKLWEYPNAGVPIIVNPFPELKRTVEGNEIGWLLPGELTPQGIAETVNSLTDEDISLAHAQCALFIARDNWEVYSLRLVHLYEKILETK